MNVNWLQNAKAQNKLKKERIIFHYQISEQQNIAIYKSPNELNMKNISFD